MESLGRSNQKLLTIISASNRPHNMAAFLENLHQTLDDPKSVEVLVKIDIGDEKMRVLMEDAVKRYPYEIRFIQTDRLDGYYTLHHGYQELWKMSDPQTYFIFPVNEEVRFLTKGWDTILRKYVGLYDDDMFRLKISRLKYRNYYSYHDCGPCPENYPISTRTWYELAEGIGDCWGPDGWHQYIDYHLGVCHGINGIPGIFRSIPLQDIAIGGEEAGKELSKEQMRKRAHRIYCEWWRMYSPTVQQRIRRLATKMAAYIWAKNEKIAEFELIENKRSMIFYVVNKKTQISAGHFYYYLSPWNIRYQNFCYLVKWIRKNNIGYVKGFILHTPISSNIVLKSLDRMVRSSVVLLGIIISLLTRGFESGPKSDIKLHYRRIRHCMIELQHRIFGEKSRVVHSVKVWDGCMHYWGLCKASIKTTLAHTLRFALGQEKGTKVGRKLRNLYYFVKGR